MPFAWVFSLIQYFVFCAGTDSTLAEQMQAMKAAVEDVMDKCGQISEDAMDASQSSENAKIDIEEAEKVCREKSSLLQALFCSRMRRYK